MKTNVGELILGQAAFKASLEQAECRLALEAAHDRKRISMLESHNGKPKRTDVNKEHLDLLASTLLAKARAGQRGVSYSEAADILQVGKSSVCKLRNLIAADPRFNISWHPNRPNMKIISLKRYSEVNSEKSLHSTFNDQGISR